MVELERKASAIMRQFGQRSRDVPGCDSVFWVRQVS